MKMGVESQASCSATKCLPKLEVGHEWKSAASPFSLGVKAKTTGLNSQLKPQIKKLKILAIMKTLRGLALHKYIQPVLKATGRTMS